MNQSGELTDCTKWKDFALAEGARFENEQGAVRDTF